MNLQAPISTIMTPDPKVVKPEDPITVVDDLFRQHRIHHVPVIDEENHVIGIISKSDFLYLIRGFSENDMDRFRHQAMMRAFKVQEIMHGEVETVRTDDPIKKAVGLLAQNRFRCLPVLDEHNLIAGIVTTHDIVAMVDRLA